MLYGSATTLEGAEKMVRAFYCSTTKRLIASDVPNIWDVENCPNTHVRLVKGRYRFESKKVSN